MSRLPPSLRAGTSAACAALLLLLGLTAGATAQDQAGRPATVTASQPTGTVTVGGQTPKSVFAIQGSQASADVPRHDVICAGDDTRPRLRCDIRFDRPTSATIRAVGQGAAPDNCATAGPEACWSASLIAVTPKSAEAPDDSAFFFMVDRGGRFPARINRAISDLRGFVDNAGPRQQIAIGQFGQNLDTLANFTSDKREISGAIGRIRPDQSRTELYKSAVSAVDLLEKRAARRKILVIFSDGSSADSAFTAQRLVEAANRADVHVVVVGSAANPSDRSPLQPLEDVATKTRGALVVPTRGTRLPDKTIAEFMGRFTSGYLLTADAPRSPLPQQINVALQFANSSRSSFVVQATAQSVDPMRVINPVNPIDVIDDRTYVQQALDFFDEYLLYIGAGLLALAVLLIALFLFLRSRRAAARDNEDFAPGPVVPPPAVADAPPPATATPYTPPPPADDPIVKPMPPVDASRPATTPPEPRGPEVMTAAPVSPRPPKPAVFLEIGEPGGSKRVVPITRNLTAIGRDEEDSDVVFPESHVSRHHAALVCNAGGEWEIRNKTWRRPAAEGGRNPIDINGVRLEAEASPLRDGDVVRLGNLGNTRFTFRARAAAPGTEF